VLTGSLRPDERLLAVVALAALVFPLLGVDRLLPWALVPLAACVLVAAGHGDIGNGSIAVAAALLLLVAECASAAGDLAGVSRVERPLAGRLIVRIAAETVAAGGLAALVLASGSLDVRPGLGTLAVGLLATVALLALVAGVVTRR
jgi:hypothetical protein